MRSAWSSMSSVTNEPELLSTMIFNIIVFTHYLIEKSHNWIKKNLGHILFTEFVAMYYVLSLNVSWQLFPIMPMIHLLALPLRRYLFLQEQLVLGAEERRIGPRHCQTRIDRSWLDEVSRANTSRQPTSERRLLLQLQWSLTDECFIVVTVSHNTALSKPRPAITHQPYFTWTASKHLKWYQISKYYLRADSHGKIHGLIYAGSKYKYIKIDYF